VSRVHHNLTPPPPPPMWRGKVVCLLECGGFGDGDMHGLPSTPCRDAEALLQKLCWKYSSQQSLRACIFHSWKTRYTAHM